MADTGSITLATYEGVGITLIVFASVFVGIRCFVNFHMANHNLGIDDYLSIVGLCLLIATYVVNDYITRFFMQPVQSLDLIYIQKISVVIIILVQGTLWFSKAPILFLYLRLFGVHKWLRYISWVTLVVAALVYIIGLIFTLVHCPIDPDNATFPAYQDCAAANTLTGVISGFISVIVDTIIFTLPIPIIVRLKLKTSKKIGLGLAFFSGILGIVASVIALYYKWQALYGDGTQLVVPIFCFTIEGIVALVVGCAPAIKSFWSRYITKKTRPKTQESTYGYHRGNSQAKKNPRGSTWEGSNEHINGGQTGAYIRMETY